MRIHHGIDGLRALPRGAVLSIGNFDGVHRGHRALLELAGTTRERLAASSLAVATFEPHPLTVLRPELAPPRLTDSHTKQRLLADLGVDHLVILPPDPEILHLSDEAFWTILRDQTRPAALVEGANFTFGKDRRGTIERLRRWMAGTGIELHLVTAVRVPLLDLRILPVSSSLIRWLLALGRARDAAIALGRAYGLRGAVVGGFQRGRTIGFPTANLDIGDQLAPAEGVYAGRCAVDGAIFPAALSIGTLPTFSDSSPRQIEAHLIGFDGDLYGRTLEVEVLDWLREQRKYPSVDGLKSQMRRDVQAARSRMGRDPARLLIAVD